MAVKKGDKIKVDYTGKFEDGTVFDSSKHGDHSHPLEFEVGEGKVIAGFDEAVVGMEIGDEKKVEVEPENGYGERNDKLVAKVPKEQLPKDKEVQKGMALVMQAPDGRQIPAVVTEVAENDITIDLNHPLAGKKLFFEVKLLEIN